MKKNQRLLLVENVDNLGIVGDVVNVRLGYARNFLLPRGLATEPSEELLKGLATKRAEAQKELAVLRKEREALIARLAGVEMTIERSCNDQGILYGSVTQQDLSQALSSQGFGVRAREVRLPHVIKRIGDFEIHIKLDSDLQTDVKLHVKADRVIQSDAREEMEFDNEGNLIERKPRKAEPAEGAAAEGEGKPEGEKKARGDKPEREKSDKPRPDKGPKKDKPARASSFEAMTVETTKGWGFGAKGDAAPAPSQELPAKEKKSKGKRS